MKNSYILWLAVRNLVGHRMRTVLTTAGVAISVGFVVFLVSLGLGLQRISTNQIANMDALKNLNITSGKSKVVNVNEKALDKIATLSDVSEVQAAFSNPAKIKLEGSTVDGVLYAKNQEYIDLEYPKYSISGKYTSNNAEEVALSTEALVQMGVSDFSSIIGRSVTVSSTLKTEDTGLSEPKKIDYNLKVIAVVDDKTAPYIYVPLNILKRDGVENFTTAIAKVNNKENVEKLKVEVENMGYKTSSVKETVDQINQFFSVFQLILLSFGGISIIVACLGVFNTLTISLLEKTREVGFMKALGATRKDVYKLFTAESLIIGLLGSVVGLGFSLTASNLINLSVFSLALATGNQAVELFYTPIYLIGVIILISLFISFLTGLYPSFRAMRISPLDALRYE